MTDLTNERAMFSVEDQELIAKSNQLSVDGDPAGQVAIIEPLARKYPNSLMLQLFLAGAYDDLEDYRLAEKHALEATRMRPSYELASILLFHALWDQEKFDDAIAESRRFLRLCPDSEEYRLLFQEIGETF